MTDEEAEKMDPLIDWLLDNGQMGAMAADIILGTRSANKKLRSDRARLTAEVERLTKALREIEDMEPATQEMSLAHMMADIARAALTPEGQSGGNDTATGG